VEKVVHVGLNAIVFHACFFLGRFNTDVPYIILISVWSGACIHPTVLRWPTLLILCSSEAPLEKELQLDELSDNTDHLNLFDQNMRCLLLLDHLASFPS
jgi:hypothetical protein